MAEYATFVAPLAATRMGGVRSYLTA